MPEGNKSRVSGDELESNRPATNFPGISVDSDRVDYLVERKSKLREPSQVYPKLNRSGRIALVEIRDPFDAQTTLPINSSR